MGWVLAVAAPVVGAPAGETKGLPIRADGSSVTADVAERVAPAVVFIRTEQRVGADNGENAPFNFFRDFFPDEEPRGRSRRMPGGGSGFIFDSEGRVLTNYHVIRDAEKITVVVEKGEEEEEFDARVVGFDRHTDIAIIQIEGANGLPKVVLGDSDGIRVGDWVMAIGTPFGQLQGTVTVGIVSAKGRNDLNIMGGDATYQNYLQTDASINFGNSGGPLVNMKGEAIGINTAINPSGQGIGFAIPINMAKAIMGELIAKGRVRYGYLGIQLQELDRTLAQGMGLSVEHGILVQGVQNDTPAARAGMKQGDVIVRFNGETVSDDSKFRLMVAGTPVGKTVPVTVLREGSERRLDVTVAERPDEDVVASAPKQTSDAWLGLHVEDATSGEARRQFGLERGQGGVVVTNVEEGSPAEDAGLQQGDVITEVYSHEVGSIGDYSQIAKKLKDRKEPIAFLVKRGRNTQYVPVIPARK